MTIRFALPHEGPVIQALFQAKGLPLADWVDWTKPLAQNWLIAEFDQPVGCIMLNYGTPIGRMEFLVVLPGLSRRIKASVVRGLCYAGMEQLSRHGSQLVASIISLQSSSWQRVAERRGGRVVDTGHLYLKRL